MLSFTFLFATTVVTAHDVEISAADLEEKGLLHKLSQEIFANAEPQEDASFNSADASFDSAEVHDSEQLELDDAVFEVDLTHTGVCGADTTCWELFEQEIHKLEMDDDTKVLLAKAESHGNSTMSIVHSDPLRRRAYGAPAWCYRGVLNGNTCCALSCGTCGGDNCEKREGGASQCCVGTIKRECNSFGDVGCNIPDDGHEHITTAGSPPEAKNGECWLSVVNSLTASYCHLFTVEGRFTPWYDVSMKNGVRVAATCEERVQRWQHVVREQCNLETEVYWINSKAARLWTPESRIIYTWGGDLHREFEPYCQVREDMMPVIWDEDGEIREDALGLNNFLSTDGTWDGFEDFETPSECALACARNDECVDWWFAVEAADGTSHCLGFDAIPHLAARIDWPESLEENVNISLSVVGKPCINELPVCFAEYGYDYNGNDINKVPGVKSAEDCANRCYDFIGCNSWTWNTGSWCYMKAYAPMDTKSNRKAHKNAVSGAPCIRGAGSKAMSNYGWTPTRVAKEVFANLMMQGTTGSAQTLAWALVKSGFYMGLTGLHQTAFHKAWNSFFGIQLSWALKQSAVASLTGLPSSLLWSFASTFVFVVANVGFDVWEYSVLEGCTMDCYSNHCNYDTLPWLPWLFSVGYGGYGNLQKGVTYRERGVILLTGCCSGIRMLATDQCNYCCPDGRELKKVEMKGMARNALGLAQYGINPGPDIDIKIPLERADEFGEIPEEYSDLRNSVFSY